MTATDRDALAARYFPVEWARCVNLSGASKRRQKLRKQAEDAQLLEQLRVCGSRCDNCGSFSTREIPGMDKKPHCERYSDFHGVAFVDPDGLCTMWRERTQP